MASVRWGIPIFGHHMKVFWNRRSPSHHPSIERWNFHSKNYPAIMYMVNSFWWLIITTIHRDSYNAIMFKHLTTIYRNSTPISGVPHMSCGHKIPLSFHFILVGEWFFGSWICKTPNIWRVVFHPNSSSTNHQLLGIYPFISPYDWWWNSYT